MKKIKIIAAAGVLLSTIACQKEEYMLYNDVARLQFGPSPKLFYESTKDLTDTLKRMTFYYENPDVTQDTVLFDIYAVGGISNQDRTFTLQQVEVPNTNNAIPGTHYKAFSDPEVSKLYVLKAGQYHTTVPVVVLRDASLKASNMTLKFQILANENFQLGEASKLWRKVEFADRLVQPTNWNNFLTTLGKYSAVKHEFMVNHTHQKWDQDFIVSISADGAILTYWMSACKTALNNYNNDHPGNPLKDETGALVVFP